METNFTVLVFTLIFWIERACWWKRCIFASVVGLLRGPERLANMFLSQEHCCVRDWSLMTILLSPVEVEDKIAQPFVLRKASKPVLPGIFWAPL